MSNQFVYRKNINDTIRLKKSQENEEVNLFSVFENFLEKNIKKSDIEKLLKLTDNNFYKFTLERLLKVRLWKYWFAKKEEEFTPEQEKCIYWLFRKIYTIPNLSKSMLSYLNESFWMTSKTDCNYFYENIYWNIKKYDFIDLIIALEEEIKRAKNKKDKIRDNLLEHTKYCLFSYCKDSYLWILLYLFDSWEFWKEEFEIIMNWKSGTKKITEETKQKMEETLEIDKK